MSVFLLNVILHIDLCMVFFPPTCSSMFFTAVRTLMSISDCETCGSCLEITKILRPRKYFYKVSHVVFAC